MASTDGRRLPTTTRRTFCGTSLTRSSTPSSRLRGFPCATGEGSAPRRRAQCLPCPTTCLTVDCSGRQHGTREGTSSATPESPRRRKHAGTVGIGSQT
eukprot:5766651-Prymnesium_polylepis.1